MVLASTSVLMVENAPQNGCHQHLCPQGESPLPPVSWEGSLRSASDSDPVSFQITASVLGFRTCEIMHTPIKSKVSVSCNSLAFLHTSPAGFQSQIFRGLIFPVQDPWAGKPSVGPQTSCSLRRTSAIVIIFLLVGHLSRGVGLDYAKSLSLIPISLLFLLYTFSCGKSFLLIFKSFMLIVAL